MYLYHKIRDALSNISRVRVSLRANTSRNRLTLSLS